MKKIVLLPFLLISSIVLSGCDGKLFHQHYVNDDKKNISSFSVPFVNEAPDDYTILENKMTIYTVDDGSIPYVSIDGFLSTLKGFFNLKNIKKSVNKFNNEYVLTMYDQYKITFDWNQNTISSASIYNFNSLQNGSSGNSLARKFIKTTYDYDYGNKAFLVKLSDYYFDIYYYKGECLIPLFFANTLFCSEWYYNIFYNGDCCYGVSGEVYSLDKYYDCSQNGKEVPDDMRKAAVNSMLFVFDYLYGLKEDKEYKLFKDYISKESMSLLWSNDSSENYKGYKQIIYGLLDELHTRIDLPSYYCDPTTCVETSEDYGDFHKSYVNLRNQQRELRTSTLGGLVPVRYSNNVAIITFDSFLLGSESQLYDSSGYLKSDAWQYDTYYYMRHCMQDIKNHSSVEKVLIDLSLNGGGVVVSLFKALGFLTDQKIPYSTYNPLANNYSITSYLIDTDGDGQYPNDAYNEYEWNLLVSLNSFSAANTFTSVFKEMNLGKIYGHKSGGGMCSVLPLVLADGTAIAISSNNTARFVSERNNTLYFQAIEHGIEPDVEINYEDYYNDSKLVQYLNSN